jgi:hypothetical protein
MRGFILHNARRGNFMDLIEKFLSKIAELLGVSGIGGLSGTLGAGGGGGGLQMGGGSGGLNLSSMLSQIKPEHIHTAANNVFLGRGLGAADKMLDPDKHPNNAATFTNEMTKGMKNNPAAMASVGKLLDDFKLCEKFPNMTNALRNAKENAEKEAKKQVEQAAKPGEKSGKNATTENSSSALENARRTRDEKQTALDELCAEQKKHGFVKGLNAVANAEYDLMAAKTALHNAEVDEHYNKLKPPHNVSGSETSKNKESEYALSSMKRIESDSPKSESQNASLGTDLTHKGP